jgi:hypothetical protein
MQEDDVAPAPAGRGRDAIPREVQEVDERLAELATRVAVAPHLNPTNLPAARRAFLAGSLVPPFRYRPLPDADVLLAEVGRLRPPLSHPLGLLLAQARDELAIAVRALRDRSAAAFDAWNQVSGWYPRPRPRSPAAAPAPPKPVGIPVVPAATFRATLIGALDERGWSDWKVELDPVMAARILVDTPRRLIRVRSDARFHADETDVLVAHEIDVHVCRAWNGARQRLRIFELGTPGSSATEEGLALLAETAAGRPFDEGRHCVISAAATLAREASFADVYAFVEGAVPGLGWSAAVRLKRGLARPGEPGVFARDASYYEGFHLVREWLAAGGDLRRLFAAKVKVQDPLDEWVARGWLRLDGRIPPWAAGAGARLNPPG